MMFVYLGVNTEGSRFASTCEAIETVNSTLSALPEVKQVTSKVSGKQPSCLLLQAEVESSSTNDDHSAAQRLVDSLMKELDISPSEAEADSLLIEGVEVLLTAPCALPMESSALNAFFVSTNVTQEAAETFLDLGMVVMKDTLSADELCRLQKHAQLRIEDAERQLERKLIPIGEQDFRFVEMSSRQAHRFDLLFPAHDTFVSDIAQSAPWVGLVTSLLGIDVECDISVVYSRPGAGYQNWHADGPHLSADITSHAARPYALCVFLPLVDLDHERGYTQFWPRSHHSQQLVGFGAGCELLETNLDAIFKVGDAVCYDYRLIHRGMPNRSTVVRPLLQFLYRQTHYKEKRNYGTESLWA